MQWYFSIMKNFSFYFISFQHVVFLFLFRFSFLISRSLKDKNVHACNDCMLQIWKLLKQTSWVLLHRFKQHRSLPPNQQQQDHHTLIHVLYLIGHHTKCQNFYRDMLTLLLLLLLHRQNNHFPHWQSIKSIWPCVNAEMTSMTACCSGKGTC